MNESMRAIDRQLSERANQLVEFLVTQPPKRLAMRAAVDFAWWCVGEGAAHRHALQHAGRLPAADTGHTGPEE